VTPGRSILTIALLVSALPALAQQPEFPLYVGRDACLECHGEGLDASPCAAERHPEHVAAYGVLGTAEARRIATVSGIVGPPAESRVCLECHATAADVGPRWTADSFRIADGVQCEACHQAGGFHAAARRDDSPEPAFGMPGAIRRNDTSGCEVCHQEKASHRLVLKEGYRPSETNRHYKTPVNLVVSADGRLLYVVCEQSDSLVVVDVTLGRVVDEIAVGSRPQDVSLSPDGKRVYVTNRFSASLTVIDTTSRRTVAEVPVGHEPHGVLTDHNGDRIFVLNTGQGSISVIDASKLVEVGRLVAGRGPWSLAAPGQGRFAYVTSTLPDIVPFRESPRSEITQVDLERGVVRKRLVVPEANMLQGIAAVPGSDVALFTMMRTKSLVPTTRLAQGWTITNGLGVVWPDGRVDQVLLDEPNAAFPDPMDIAVAPGGRFALVVSGGTDRVAVVDVPALLALTRRASDYDRRHLLPNHLGQADRFVVKRIAVGHNPRAVVFSPDGKRAYVANALDDSVSVVETAEFEVVGEIALGGPAEITEVRRGQRLFHSAGNAFGQQFSCRSCHPDGHINGLTLDIEADGIGLHPVDNRTLRGILDTGPFKWEGTNPSLRRQCGARLAVFFTRLDPFSNAELTALERYMYTIERPPNHRRDAAGLTPAQRRGKAVFERRLSAKGHVLAPSQRCVHCHNGGYRTSRATVESGTTLWFDARLDVEPEHLTDVMEFGELGSFLFPDVGLEQKKFDVPHLNNIHDSAPYLHNGAAATLEEIWTRFNLIGGHGATHDLTRRQFNDLIEYLKVQ
jgi:YVTN family beta-propeller protein